MGWVKRSPKDYLVPTPTNTCHQIDCLEHIKPGLQRFQEWGRHSFSGKPPSPSKNLFLKCNLKVPSFSLDPFPLILSLHAHVNGPYLARSFRVLVMVQPSLVFSWRGGSLWGPSRANQLPSLED